MDATKCDHIIGVKENGERDHKFTFADGEQIDLVKASDYQAAAKYCRAAGESIDAFKFCPACGESLDGRFPPIIAPTYMPEKLDAFEGYWMKKKKNRLT